MKVLRILFILLIIFSVVEIGYYIYLQTKTTPSKYSPVPTLAIVPTSNISALSPTPGYDFSILNSIRNGYASKATLVKQYTGTLIRYNENGTYPSGYKYLYSFQVVSQKGEINLGYSSSDWKLASVFKRTGGRDIPANIEDIKPNSKIEINETWDISKDEDRLEKVVFVIL